MNRIVPVLTALALTAGAASAQQPGTYTPPYTPSSPTTSPYLNLLHSGNPAINYYGIVRPQIQQSEQLQQLQFGLNRTAAERPPRRPRRRRRAPYRSPAIPWGS